MERKICHNKWYRNMNKIYFILFISFLIPFKYSIARESGISKEAIGLLKAEQPKVKWDTKTTVLSDFTCDGITDSATVGYENGKAVWIGVVPGGDGKAKTKPITMGFGINSMEQASFCSTPVEIDVRPIYCEDEDMGKLPGCKQIKGCSEFSMADNSCDSFNFYWDSNQSKLVWWRR